MKNNITHEEMFKITSQLPKVDSKIARLYITQEQAQSKRLEKVEELLENIIIESDELGLEPTTLTKETGAEITKRWNKMYKALEEELK